MKLYYYVITRDYGFAPNPFYGICTLATCKPRLRRIAEVGDWVVGIGSANKLKSNYKRKVIFAMQISEKMTFDDYWDDERFKDKKPVMNGSLQQIYGDNIYHTNENGEIIQLDSHHSYPLGVTNFHNLRKDTSGKMVLISNYYWYFGRNARELPENFNIIKDYVRDYKTITEQSFIDEFVKWLNEFEPNRRYGKPDKADEAFERYDGVS